MRFPSFHDTQYIQAEKIFITDRFIDRAFLWMLPQRILPNHITLLRIIATPFVLVLLFQRRYDIAVPFFLFTACTDALDGALARTRNKITEWGMMFDPVADKFLIVPALLILLMQNVPTPLALTIISLELIIVFFALIWKNRDGVIQANTWGKLKMILQVLGISLLLVSVWLHIPLLKISSVILGSSIYFSIMSMIYHGA